MNHRRASTGGSNMVAVPPLYSNNNNDNSNNDYGGNNESSYLNSPEKNSGYQEEGDNSDDNQQEQIVTIITYDARRRTTRRSSFSGPITRRRGSNGTEGGSSRMIMMNHNNSSDCLAMEASLGKLKSTGLSSSSHRSQGKPPQHNLDSTTFTKPSLSEEQPEQQQQHQSQRSSIQTSRGINPDIVARMSISTKKENQHNSSEFIHLIDDDDDDSDGQNSPQQIRRGYVSTSHSGIDKLYGLNAPTLHAGGSQRASSGRRSMERRGSNASSVHSRSSRASQRRRSSVERRKFKSKDPLAAVTIYDNKHQGTKSDISMYDTDDDPLNDDDLMSSEDEGGAGHGIVTTATGGVAGFGYESDAASEHSNTGSMSSSKRSKRRNSCIIPNGHDLAALNSSAIFNGSVIATGNRSTDFMNIYTDDEGEDEDDPDSLFNRAKRRAESMDFTKPTMLNIATTTTAEKVVSKRVSTSKVNHNTSQMSQEINGTHAQEPIVHDQQHTPIVDPVVTVPSSISHGPEMITSPLSPVNVGTVSSSNAVSVPNGTHLATTMDYVPASTVPSNAAATTLESWMTTTTSPLLTKSPPATVAYAAPTEENLRANFKLMLRVDKFSAIAMSPTRRTNPKVVRTSGEDTSHHHRPFDTDDSAGEAGAGVVGGGGGGGWNGMDHDDDDESSYGANMYTETMVPNSSSEYDMYHQKARRRASLECTHYNIDTIFESKGIKVPNFKPADGCKNASDFVVRCFTARMRISGFTVLKHNRSRWSKAKNRIIYLLPDNQTLSWRECDDDTMKLTTGGKNDTNHKNKHGLNDVKNDKDSGVDALHPLRHNNSSGVRGPKIDLSKCIEVRYACSIDPKNVKKRGTPVLRSRCKDELAGKSFSLIFANRTLDLTAFSNDQCKVLMEGFSALCFRIQLQKLESKNNQTDNQNHSDSDKHASNVADDQCTSLDVDDWASTMFGGSTTNTSNSNYMGGNTPWGR